MDSNLKKFLYSSKQYKMSQWYSIEQNRNYCSFPQLGGEMR